MPCRTEPSVTSALFALGVLWIASCGPIPPPTAWADDLSIRFDDIEDLMRHRSPRARILVQELFKIEAERDMALQWTNPELAHDREEVETSREWQLTLEKQFSEPLSHGQRRRSWAAEVRATGARIEQESADLLADLKSGYVRLRLLDVYLERHAHIEKAVRKASAAAESKHAEGEISGAGGHLMRLAALSLETQRIAAIESRGELAASWAAEMGFSAYDSVRLATPITFHAVDLPPVEQLVRLSAGQPGLQAREFLRDALGLRANASRPSLLPGFTLYGGYKRIEDAHDGYVLGGALRLPLFDRNPAASRSHEAERVVVEQDLEIRRSRLAGEIQTLVRTIEQTRDLLSSIADRLERKPSVAADLVYAYEEGVLSLDALLNAIQIEVAGLEDYYDLLGSYYANLFRLESLTGTDLVSFES
ncbi:MAG: TolC family protein [Candidatus Eisenbacteria bacterium]|nr:TolC family protein [Candidatus Eisenbacteria bacterium]